MRGIGCEERDRLFDEYSWAARRYSSIVLRLDQRQNSGMSFGVMKILNEADTLKRNVDQSRRKYTEHCEQHGCDGISYTNAGNESDTKGDRYGRNNTAL